MKRLLLLIYNTLLAIYAVSSLGIKPETIFFVIGLGILFVFGNYLLRQKSAAVFALMLVEIRGLLQCVNGFKGIMGWYDEILFFAASYIVVVMLVKTSFIQKIYQNKIVGFLLMTAIPVLLILTYLHGPLSEDNNARVYITKGIMAFPVVLMIFPFVVAAMLHRNTEKTVSKRKKSLPVNQLVFVIYCLIILIISGLNQDLGIAAVLVSAGFITFFLYSRNLLSRIVITLGGIASVFLAVKLFNKISMRWMLFADLQQASIDSTYGAQEAAVFLFGKRIMQHSGMMGLGLGATNSLNRVYKTLKNDYIIEKIVIEMGNMTLAVVLVLLAALVFSMLKLPAVNLFDEVLNLAIVMTICATCMLSAASALNCMPPVGVPFLGLSEGNSLFLAFGVLLGVNDGIKRRALKNEKICDQQ